MRSSSTVGGLTVHAVAGTHAVLLGFDLVDPAGCLGFGVRRTDHTEDESYWLRGLKTFASLVPHPSPGMDFSLRDHPVQGFQWGDYTAKPDHEYTYDVVAWRGAPGALEPLLQASVRVRTEPEDDGTHGVWFNRGVAGSQAFAKRFGHSMPPAGADESHPAFAWLSRGLAEAFLAFVGRASGPEWGLRGAFYEFTWGTGLKALAAASAAGADVALVVHGRDKDSDAAVAAGKDADRTAADNRAAVTAAGLDGVVTWRTAPLRSALQHNKFLVLTHHGQPVSVWTGSTNLTPGALFGHLNVSHLVHDPAVAAQFVDYWALLADQASTTAVARQWTETQNPVDPALPPPDGVTAVLSPRGTKSPLLDWYARTFDAATDSAHITGAFGLHKVFRDVLARDRDVVRTVLLDKRPPRDTPVPATDPDVRTSWGDYLQHATLEGWADEQLTGFNTWVKFVHTKVILVDPLTDSPTVFTGSANYSDNSTTDNEENTVVVRGAAARRVADIYLTEYQRLFMHFVFRNWATLDANDPEAITAGAGHLDETSGWTERYYRPGGWRERQRRTFARTGR
ncbi:phospholipase D-like domain-containing protein [Kineosporia sp. A_224]|uniref:phospholipase D-like domain-containing protein n=1 Tax=Kineosporia sp. A_224 TaxID=1962180 RepID=UPI000B4BEF01|nr:phospholipase D-like domain-containing protein [Kineosporia sp. A_224]